MPTQAGRSAGRRDRSAGRQSGGLAPQCGPKLPHCGSSRPALRVNRAAVRKVQRRSAARGSRSAEGGGPQCGEVESQCGEREAAVRGRSALAWPPAALMPAVCSRFLQPCRCCNDMAGCDHRGNRLNAARCCAHFARGPWPKIISPVATPRSVQSVWRSGTTFSLVSEQCDADAVHTQLVVDDPSKRVRKTASR